MFSQFRSAVEQLAQQPARILDASSPPPDNQAETPSRSQSLDIRTGSSQLAESAISSLRKSFVAQRPNGSPASNPANSPASSSAPGSTPSARPKSNLEERLRRATYAIAEANKSPSPTPAQSSSRPPNRASGSPSPMARLPMKSTHKPSPASTPLPGSPIITPAKGPKNTIPADFQLNNGTDSLASKADTPLPNKPPAEDTGATLSASHTQVLTHPLQSEPLEEPKKEEGAKSVPQDAPDQSAVEVPAETPNPSDAASPEAPPSEPDKAIPPADTHEAAIEAENPTPSVEPVVEISVDDPNQQQAVKADEATSLPDETSTSITPPPPSEPEANENDSNIAASDKPLLHVDVVQAVAHELMAASLAASPVPTSPHLVGVDPDEPVSPSSLLPPTDLAPELITEAIKRVLLEKETLTDPIVSSPAKDQSSEVETLQARLKQVEQRFSDVSTSFKRLQAEKLAADAVLREVSPLDGIKDADALRAFFDQLKTKDEVFQDEVKRLNKKLEAQEDRIEEIQAKHKEEMRTMAEDKNKIKTQLDETEKLFEATQIASTQSEDAINSHKEDISRLQKEVEVHKSHAKEEEEKRVKAISLLKTVRQKLVKAEKDREDALKEIAAAKEREKGDRSKDEALKQSYQQETEKLNVNHERAIATLRSQFDKDFASMRERYEKEIAALRGQSELEISSLKSTHSKELNAKATLITSLESSLNKVTQDKNEFFDSLQLRQAELESAQSHLESLQHQNTELQFQLRESNARVALLKEEVAELMREQESRTRDPGVSADDIARMVSGTEAKYEARLAESQRRLAALEKERYESEADWSRKLKEKVKDLEELRRILGTANKSRENDESVVASLKEQLGQERNAVKALQNQVAQLPLLKEHIIELERTSKDQEKEINLKHQILEKQIEESKAREAQLKQSNKSLKDELRKVQSSAALLERQRNPGVGGYWGNRGESGIGNGSSVSLPSAAAETNPSRVSSPAPTAASGTQEEEVNLEYLRNVILQFLEHKEMRPNLVRVLSIILHFTPQETRRLIAKV